MSAPGPELYEIESALHCKGLALVCGVDEAGRGPLVGPVAAGAVILPEGLIVYTEDKYGNRSEERSEGKHPLDIPLAVLVNESSASASEIFAGAVQDYGIGTIVGTTTYGKGVVQSIRTLADGSAVKLTVSNYFTPKGNSIHEVGISPDVEVKLDANLLNKEEITHEEDNQLQKALEILEKS